MNEMMALQQMMSSLGSSAGLVWIQVTLLLALIAVIVLRRQSIIRLSAFRYSFICLGMSVLVPSVITGLMPALAHYLGGSSAFSGYGGRGSSGLSSGWGILYPLLTGVGPVLVGTSVLFLCRAIVPTFIPPDGNDGSPPIPGPRPTPSRPVDAE